MFNTISESVGSVLETLPIPNSCLIPHLLLQVYNGGLSSYGLILMAVSFLQLHQRPDVMSKSSKANLGVLLLEFFELYGRNFNYSQTAIRLRDGGSYAPREEVARNMLPGNSSGGITLCIEDPLDATNDVGKGSFLFYRVKDAFEDAYIELARLMRPGKLLFGAGLPTAMSPKVGSSDASNRSTAKNYLENSESSTKCKSILSHIICISKNVTQFRQQLSQSQPVSSDITQSKQHLWKWKTCLKANGHQQRANGSNEGARTAFDKLINGKLDGEAIMESTSFWRAPLYSLTGDIGKRKENIFRAQLVSTIDPCMRETSKITVPTTKSTRGQHSKEMNNNIRGIILFA